MKNKKDNITKIPVTAQKVSQLMTLFAAPPASSHLSDDELIGYAMQTLHSSDVPQVEAHLALCEECMVEVQQLLSAAPTWQGKTGEKRLTALRERVFAEMGLAPDSLQERLRLALQEIRASWQATFANQPAWAAATADGEARSVWEGEFQDGLLRVEGELDPNGDLTFWFDSEEMALQGKHFRLSWQELEREFTLRQVSATEVGAQVLILAHERPAEWMEFVLEEAG